MGIFEGQKLNLINFGMKETMHQRMGDLKKPR